MNVDNMDKDLKEVYDPICQEILHVCIRWGEYNTLYDAGNDHIEVINKTAPHFFGMVQTGFQENIVLHIARLVDPPCMGKNKNLSIKLFPELIQNGKLREELKELICLADRAACPCKVWRKKWYAHRDKVVALDPKANPLPISSNLRRSIDDSIKAIWEILGKIRAHYCNEQRSELRYIPDPRGARGLLEILGEHVRTQQENFKAKRERYEKAKQSSSS